MTWSAIGRQLRHAMGAFGWTVGHFMRFLNARSNALAIAALDLQGDEDILELGCGPGRAVKLMAAQAPRGVIHAIDQSAAMLAQSRSRNWETIRAGCVHLYQARFEDLPLRGRSIDKILAVNVAYFWSDSQRILREARRVLRPGGTLSVYVTDVSTMRQWKFANAETHRLFDTVGLVGMLQHGGFHREQVTVTNIEVLPGMTGLIATVGNPCDVPALGPRNVIAALDSGPKWPQLPRARSSCGSRLTQERIPGFDASDAIGVA